MPYYLPFAAGIGTRYTIGWLMVTQGNRAEHPLPSPDMCWLDLKGGRGWWEDNNHCIAHCRIQAYASEHLPTPTYNHSRRVYHFGLAIKRHRFPSWSFSDETYFLACRLHDIGTTDEDLRRTRLSFEFYGGMLATEVLRDMKRGGGEEERWLWRRLSRRRV
ncbi:urea hydro-lyase/cyanamide hydratase [Blastomyces dermatitidis ER-3]|uniref:Urea hydro-lyase/cyanamide hydratase n=1 Tax=Ajellomyces dermatitidis (strain ER-3 / ATCC MYA-2586) TaxID=559297 RepID=A0ABP2ERS3_AJEDR|nr:urea hydro-lyase/cyanamide hydratase [Blastomyces dermatitidis ER-3]EEQ85178.2 urea hydro-lyase/cyanamide hydratase [Blastomyces dermatitidis ER-3]